MVVINVEITKNTKNKVKRYQLIRKFNKQVRFLEINPRHNSLNFKPLKVISGVWRFRIDKHFWGLVIKMGKDRLRIYDVIKHL